MKLLSILTILLLLLTISGCAQGIYKDQDVYIKVNTLFKDITWGDYESAVAKFKAITPYGIIETEEGE